MTGGFGTADTGGAWTVSPAARFSTSGGVGSISLATAGAGTNAYLGGTSATSADVTVTLAVDKRPTASAYLDVVGRRVGTNQEYAGLRHADLRRRRSGHPAQARRIRRRRST